MNHSTLRVAMIIQGYFPHLGGAESQLAALAPLLQQAGIEVQVLTRRFAGLSAFEVINGVPVHRLPIPGPKPLAALSFTLSALPLLRRLRPHLIHAHELLSPATTALAAKRLFGQPVVAKVLRGGQLGDLSKLKHRRFGQQRINSIRKGIDAFVVISREIDQELAEVGVPTNRRVFIPNGVDLARFAPASATEKAALRNTLNLPPGPIALFAGRLDAEKRVNHLVNIWPQVLQTFPNAHLLILGSGSEEQTLRQAAGPNVIFSGYIADTAPFFRAADIFVLPSVTEGLSNALLEAMASGLGIIITPVGGTTDVITHGENGWLIAPDDPQALATALLHLLSDAGLCQRLAQAGHERVARDYALPAVARRLHELYQSLC